MHNSRVRTFTRTTRKELDLSEQANPSTHEVKCLDEEQLANATGGGGIIQVLNHPGYIAAQTLGAEPPQGVSKPTAIKPQRGWVDQDRAGQPGGRTTVVYHGGGNQYTTISVPNPSANPQAPRSGLAFHKP
jgi:hypothetical protein